MSGFLNKVLALIFPLALALLLTAFIPVQQEMVIDQRLQLQRVKVASVDELKSVFDDLAYTWPPEAKVPAIEVSTLPKDMAKVANVRQKKSLFFRALLPIVLAENEKLAELREHVVVSIDKGIMNLGEAERRWLKAIATEYKLKGSIAEAKVQQRLLRRVDVIPPALVLAQAANESAWGTSRFARQGNNLFGQWTYRQSEGIVPLGRPEGETYAVRAFSTIDASVRAYMHNLNTNPAYKKLRQLRIDMRKANVALDGHRLANGLLAYSSRGEEYVQEIQAMIRSNRLLTRLEKVSLKREP